VLQPIREVGTELHGIVGVDQLFGGVRYVAMDGRITRKPVFEVETEDKNA